MMAARRGGRPDVLLLCRASFILVGLYVWLLPLARAYLPLGPVGDLADACFALICHRMPERMLSYAGVAMPVCSRCAGIALGVVLGAAVGWPRPTLKQARIALAAAAALMLADIVTQDAGLHPPWHATRLSTGALLGYLALITLVAAIARDLAKPPTNAAPQPSPPPNPPQ